jgi:hypothetical protein
MDDRQVLRLDAVLAGFMALGAGAGTVGLWVGSIDFGPEITARLPWGSTGFAGAALLLVVAVPMAVAAVAAWRGDPRAPALLVVAGLLLFGWIVVELAFIRSVSWLHPLCALWGVVVALLGWRVRRDGAGARPGVSPGRTPGARRT